MRGMSGNIDESRPSGNPRSTSMCSCVTVIFADGGLLERKTQVPFVLDLVGVSACSMLLQG